MVTLVGIIRVIPGCASGVLAATYPQAAVPIIGTGLCMGAVLHAFQETGQSTSTKMIEGVFFNGLGCMFAYFLEDQFSSNFSSASHCVCSGNTTPVAANSAALHRSP